MRLLRPSPALLISCVALLLAAGGAAFGAAQAITKVQIVDPNTPSQIAQVDGGGRLLTNVSGTVNAKPIPPGNPFATTYGLHPGAAVGHLVGPTSSAIDVTAILVAAEPPLSAGSSSLVTLEAWDVPIVAPDCSTSPSPTAVVWAFEVYAVQPEVSQSFPTPLVARPPAGRKECLGVRDVGDFYGWLSVSGYTS